MIVVSGEVDGERAIYLRRLGEPDFRMVPGTENGETPNFSPDNEWIVYRDREEGAILKVAIAGGGALTLYSGRGDIRDPYWGDNGTIVFTAPGGGGLLSRAGHGGRGGAAQARHERPASAAAAGRLRFAHGGGGDVVHYDPATDSTRVLVPEAAHPTYLESGYILYVSLNGGLFSVPFDVEAVEVTGPPSRLLERVAANSARRGYSVSREGTLIHMEGEADINVATGGAGNTRLLIRGLAGQTDTLRLLQGRKRSPRFSPDGLSIAYVLQQTEGDDIYTFDLVTGTNTRITFEGDNESPIWSPDGTRILFDSEGREGADGEALFIKAADNSSPAQLVLDRPADQSPWAWLADDVIVFHSREQQSQSTDLFTYALSGNGEAAPYLQAPWFESEFALSPDGVLAALVSSETETREVWLRDYPDPQGKWQVSSGDGRAPRWSPDGSTLFYWRYASEIDSLFSVRVDREPAVVVRQRELEFVQDVVGNWNLHPDGERFIYAVFENARQPTTPAPEEEPAASSSTRYLVVLNWFEELKERVGT